MVEYSVVFAGEILPGFDRAAVRRAASDGLRASAAQLDALFSGKSVVMKRGLTLAQGKQYLAVLAKTGMHAKLTPPPPSAPAATERAAPRYNIVFRGELVRGFEAAQVSRLAANALRFNADQLQQLFSGKKAILKRGLDKVSAERFVAQLARIGMQAATEQELPATSAKSAAPVKPPPPSAPDPMAQHMETLVVGSEALARHMADMQAPPTPERITPPPQPTVEAAMARMAQSEASAASRFVRCPACGSKQPMRALCVACGKALVVPDAGAPMTVSPQARLVMPPPEAVSVAGAAAATIAGEGSQAQEPAVVPEARAARRDAAWVIGGVLLVVCLLIVGFAYVY